MSDRNYLVNEILKYGKIILPFVIFNIFISIIITNKFLEDILCNISNLTCLYFSMRFLNKKFTILLKYLEQEFSGYNDFERKDLYEEIKEEMDDFKKIKKLSFIFNLIICIITCFILMIIIKNMMEIIRLLMNGIVAYIIAFYITIFFLKIIQLKRIFKKISGFE